MLNDKIFHKFIPHVAMGPSKFGFGALIKLYSVELQYLKH